TAPGVFPWSTDGACIWSRLSAYPKRGQAPLCAAPCGPSRQRCLTPFRIGTNSANDHRGEPVFTTQRRDSMRSIARSGLALAGILVTLACLGADAPAKKAPIDAKAD